jgi:hypothetical protein
MLFDFGERPRGLGGLGGQEQKRRRLPLVDRRRRSSAVQWLSVDDAGDMGVPAEAPDPPGRAAKDHRNVRRSLEKGTTRWSMAALSQAMISVGCNPRCGGAPPDAIHSMYDAVAAHAAASNEIILRIAGAVEAGPQASRISVAPGAVGMPSTTQKRQRRPERCSFAARRDDWLCRRKPVGSGIR